MPKSKHTRKNKRRDRAGSSPKKRNFAREGLQLRTFEIKDEIDETYQPGIPAELALAQDNTMDARVRHDVAQALGQLGRVAEATTLLLALARDSAEDSLMRKRAVWALYELDRVDEVVLTGLLALARDSVEDSRVRESAAQVLSKLGQGDEVILAELLALTRNEDEDSDVRHAAYGSLQVLLSKDEG